MESNEVTVVDPAAEDTIQLSALAPRLNTLEGAHIGKGYIYAAMAFAVFVEVLNMRFRAHERPLT